MAKKALWALPMLFLFVYCFQLVRAQSAVDLIRSEFQSIIGDHNIGLDFGRMNADGSVDFRFSINGERYYPLASSFKAFIVPYYFLHTPRYKPGTEDEAWKYNEGSHLYSMAVFSNNVKTGSVLLTVAQDNGWENPISSFNDFLENELNLSMGLYSWDYPGSPTAGSHDSRFAPGGDRIVVNRGKSAEINNIAYVSQVADGYWFLAGAEHDQRWESPLFRAAISRTRTLLSIPAPGYPSPAEGSIYAYHYGKEGVLPEGDIPLGRVINEAFVVPLADGSSYIVSVMSVGESELSVVPVFDEVTKVIREYEQALHPNLIQDLGGESAPPMPGYNYGFVRPMRIELFTAPREDAGLVDNYVRANSIYGTAWVMQGALLRLSIIDDKWAKIEIDRVEDDTYGQDIFVRLSDVQLVAPEHFAPIGFVTGDESRSKYIILDIQGRTLTLFEGETPILKTPVVLNVNATPRGGLYVSTNILSRDMPNYPGVPFDALLDDGRGLKNIGYYIHGSPWHRWQQTVTEVDPLRRYSHGCINVPDWLLQIGPYVMRPDEFIFRWAGGFPGYSTDTLYHLPGDPVRVFAFDYIDSEIWYFSMPVGVLSWKNVLTAWSAKGIDAPDYYFVDGE